MSHMNGRNSYFRIAVVPETQKKKNYYIRKDSENVGMYNFEKFKQTLES